MVNEIHCILRHFFFAKKPKKNEFHAFYGDSLVKKKKKIKFILAALGNLEDLQVDMQN